MYESHFGLKERPFSLLPDPSFFFHSKKHANALAMLEYGVAHAAPIVLITGEIGAGKTTILRFLLNRLEENATVGLISNTHQNLANLMQWVAFSFGIDHERKDSVSLYRELVNFLISEYARGRRSILVIDEAQNLTAEILEELRVITNINSEKDFLIQLVLCGQPELRETLALKSLHQFSQRIAVDCHLVPLTKRETKQYIQHRINQAGCARPIFTSSAAGLIYDYSAGVPRVINSLCDTALVYAYAEGRQQISPRLVREIVRERHSKGLFGAGLNASVAPESESNGSAIRDAP